MLPADCRSFTLFIRAVYNLATNRRRRQKKFLVEDKSSRASGVPHDIRFGAEPGPGAGRREPAPGIAPGADHHGANLCL
jgi:hypothetical protein